MKRKYIQQDKQAIDKQLGSSIQKALHIVEAHDSDSIDDLPSTSTGIYDHNRGVLNDGISSAIEVKNIDEHDYLAEISFEDITMAAEHLGILPMQSDSAFSRAFYEFMNAQYDLSAKKENVVSTMAIILDNNDVSGDDDHDNEIAFAAYFGDRVNDLPPIPEEISQLPISQSKEEETTSSSSTHTEVVDTKDRELFYSANSNTGFTGISPNTVRTIRIKAEVKAETASDVTESSKNLIEAEHILAAIDLEQTSSNVQDDTQNNAQANSGESRVIEVIDLTDDGNDSADNVQNGGSGGYHGDII